MTLSRRSLITGLVSFAVTAPAIVRAASLMPVKVMDVGLTLGGVPIEFDPPGLYGATCVYYQDRVFWLSPKDPQTVLFSELLPKGSWDAATFPFSKVDL